MLRIEAEVRDDRKGRGESARDHRLTEVNLLEVEGGEGRLAVDDGREEDQSVDGLQERVEVLALVLEARAGLVQGVADIREAQEEERLTSSDDDSLLEDLVVENDEGTPVGMGVILERFVEALHKLLPLDSERLTAVDGNLVEGSKVDAIV